MKVSNKYSSEIKTEILKIIEAFKLGSFKGLISFTPSETVEGYIRTEFKVNEKTFTHWFKIN